MSSKFTIGADPEYFLMKNGKHVSAIGLIGGSKMFPRPLEREGFAVQEDNVSVEFNIAPCHDHTQFIEAIQYVIGNLKGMLPDYEFSQASAVLFDESELQHPQAMEFGCEPDFNAWTKAINPRPCAADATLRSAGGHVHVGTTEDPYEVIKAMDLFLGVPSTKLDIHGGMRRALYGGAGACRVKEYGVEYRTLSNFWIWSPKLIEWVHTQTEKAINFVSSGNKLTNKDGHLIQSCINKNDGEAYDILVKTYGLA